MEATPLEFKKPFKDAISRIRFAPCSNNLLISSWDSDSALRLYDVDRSLLRFEAESEAGLLNCYFQDESAAFAVDSDGLIARYDLHSGSRDAVGNHDDVATCAEYSDEMCIVITAGLDKKINYWDTRMAKAPAFSTNLNAEVDCMSLSGFRLTVAIGASTTAYDIRSPDRPLQRREPRVFSQIRCVSSMPSSEGYAAGSVDGYVALEVFDSGNPNDTGYTFHCLPKSVARRNHQQSVNDIAFNPLNGSLFVTGDNEGRVMAWNAQKRRYSLEFPRCPHSVASLSYNLDGQLLAVASSYTYQEADRRGDTPEIFIFEANNNRLTS